MNFSLGKLIAQYTGAFLLIGSGVFLIWEHHPKVGGWITAVGLLAYCFSNGRVQG